MNLAQDLRYAVRKLLKSPGFTAVALLTLALGIGANTAIFSVVDGVLLEPLPYPDADRVVRVWNEWEGSPRANISPAEYFDYRDRVEAFEAFGVYAASSFNMTGGDQPERVRGAFVSAGLYDAFGIEPLLGRVRTAEEDLPGQDGIVEVWTTLRMRPAEIEALGRRHLARLERELVRLGAPRYGASAPEILERLREGDFEKDFDSREDVVAHAAAAIERARHAPMVRDAG